jgi:hypothetical protein
MDIPDFEVDDLKKLPLRAIVAFAARCARRVEHLAQLPEGDPRRESNRCAVEAALHMAEEFAKGADGPPDESVVAAVDASRGVPGGPAGSEDAAAAAAEACHAAASAWHLTSNIGAGKDDPPELKKEEVRRILGTLSHVTADLATLNAFTAAATAYRSAGCHNEDFVRAALNDYNALLRLQLGRYPEVGEPVDPSPLGPLGPL